MNNIIYAENNSRIAVSWLPEKIAPLTCDRGLCLHGAEGVSLFGSLSSLFGESTFGGGTLVGRFYGIYDPVETYLSKNRVGLGRLVQSKLIERLKSLQHVALNKKLFHECINDIKNLEPIGGDITWSSNATWVLKTANAIFREDNENISWECDEAKKVRNLCVSAACDVLAFLEYIPEPLYEKMEYEGRCAINDLNTAPLLGESPILRITGDIQYSVTDKSWRDLKDIVDDILNNGGNSRMRVFHRALNEAYKSESYNEISSIFESAFCEAGSLAKKYGLSFKESSLGCVNDSFKGMGTVLKSSYKIYKDQDSGLVENIVDVGLGFKSMFNAKARLELESRKRDAYIDELIQRKNEAAWLVEVKEKISEKEKSNKS